MEKGKNMKRTYKEFWQEYYGQLKGAVVLDVGIVEEDNYGMEEHWPCFIVKLMNGKTIQIELSSDEEGNGPGFLFGLPNVDPVVR